MAYQVGPWCYASTADAAVAACAAFPPATIVLADGSGIQSASCTSATPDGGLMLRITTTPTTGAAASTVSAVHHIDFPPCQNDSIVSAGMHVFGAALTAVVLCWSAYKVYSFLEWSRAEK